MSNNGTLYRKEDFAVDLQAMTVTCPWGQSQPIQLGKVIHREPSICGPCPLRSQCTDAAANRGRSLSIALDELRQQLRGKVKTPQGRAELRQRVSVEHRLSHIVYRQGDQARYLGIRKNLFDLRRASIIPEPGDDPHIRCPSGLGSLNTSQGKPAAVVRARTACKISVFAGGSVPVACGALAPRQTRQMRHTRNDRACING